MTNNDDAAAIPLIWARDRISTLTRKSALGQNAKAAEAEITRLGLAFSLQTQNTSFVAVSQRRVNATGQSALPVDMPLAVPEGMPMAAFKTGGFAGSSTPEPQAIFGFLLIAAMAVVGLRRMKR